MQFTSIFATAALLSTSALSLALPAPAPAPAGQWTIEQFTRVCNGDDSSCNYSFGVGAGSDVVRCAYTAAGHPADQAAVNGVKCGPYTVSSSWSGQFGAGKGFTTLAVTNGKQIVFPAYSDAELAAGKAVVPDKSFPVGNVA